MDISIRSILHDRHRKIRRLFTISILAVAVFLSLTYHVSPFSTLNVVHGSGGKSLMELPVFPGEQWGIHFTHSLYRVAQEEIYQVDRHGGVVLKEVNFASYPAALYYSENPPQGFVREDGCWKIKNIDSPVSIVRFKVGYTTDCYLMIKGIKIYFKTLADGGESLVFTVRRASLVKYLYSAVLLKFRNYLM